MIHLREVAIGPQARHQSGYPFDTPIVRGLERLVFQHEVTFLVGENGSGKSTLLEAIAAAVGAISIGGHDVAHDPTLVHARALGDQLRLVWNKRTRRGFFLRAEDFFNFARRVAETKQELQAEIDRFDRELTGYGRQLAVGNLEGQKAAMERRYGEDPDAASHGEAFLNLFQARFVPGGLYLLDEPEAPLSPLRQLGLLSVLKEMVGKDAQFIIATHSPILMAYPGATLLAFEGGAPREVAYDDLEHVALTRAFLNNPAAYLRHL